MFDDGRVKYIRGHAVCKTNNNGEVKTIFGSAVDITSEKELENIIIQKNKKLESQNISLQHSISIYDLKGLVSKYLNK